jgi:hypothetical protein
MKPSSDKERVFETAYFTGCAKYCLLLNLSLLSINQWASSCNSRIVMHLPHHVMIRKLGSHLFWKQRHILVDFDDGLKWRHLQLSFHCAPEARLEKLSLPLKFVECGCKRLGFQIGRSGYEEREVGLPNFRLILHTFSHRHAAESLLDDMSCKALRVGEYEKESGISFLLGGLDGRGGGGEEVTFPTERASSMSWGRMITFLSSASLQSDWCIHL